VGIDHFGASAPAKDLFKAYGFTPDKVVEAIEKVLAK
jgi:transketolase